MPATSARDDDLARQLIAALEPLLAQPPVAGSKVGLARTREAIADRLERLGFELAHHVDDGHPPVVVALRPGNTTRWVGLSAHYDVEVEGPGWTTSAFAPTRLDDRIFARGVADNLGPLMLRLLALETAVGPLPSMAWVLQGEEEIGSPGAHRIFPGLAVPPVMLWIEETGYYELDGRQRVLLRRPSPATRPCVDAVRASAAANARTIELHDRYLNKAFGTHNCPFLTHLVGDAPYLAIGPNDPRSQIHRADESLPIANLAASADQFLAVLEAAVT